MAQKIHMLLLPVMNARRMPRTSLEERRLNVGQRPTDDKENAITPQTVPETTRNDITQHTLQSAKKKTNVNSKKFS